MSSPTTAAQAHTVLIGAGVVGTAIASAHLDAGLSVTLADQDPLAIQRALQQLGVDPARWEIRPLPAIGDVLPAMRIQRSTAGELTSSNTTTTASSPTLIIESIAERLDVKQAFFRQAETWFAGDTILCSNTSTIRLAAIGQSLAHPERLCGMHFFMPVTQRDAVEIIRSPHVSQPTIDVAIQHVNQLNKQPLLVTDAPGFVVNRMLAPYLNQAMTLLCGGVSAERIESAAIAYGMPMSPLELIDWIGTRTTFDAGRVYWQAFPTRIDPSPLIAGLIKKKRSGRGQAGGLYDYVGDTRSATLADDVLALAERYHRDLPRASDAELVELLAIPMWIEAQQILTEQVVGSRADIEIAMAGGLGYQPRGGWFDFFDALGLERIQAAIEKWAPSFLSMRAAC